MERSGYRILLAGLLGWAFLAFQAEAQTVVREREATLSGPRGRTVERRVEALRGPGMAERSVQIQRPGMTIERSVQARGGGQGFIAGPRPPVVVQRNLYVSPRPASSWSFGFGVAPLVTVPFWQPPPPPPVVIAPPPPGVVVAAAPTAPVTRPSPLDPVALAAERLQSHHAGSRREGAETLGRLGDPRAVPVLVNTLRHDSSKDVKIAAARALGLIGGHEAETVLERCLVYEKKQEVRDAAAVALRDLRARAIASPPSAAKQNRVDQTGSAAGPGVVPRLPARPAPPPRPALAEQEPALDGSDASGPDPTPTVRVPPPPPTPVAPQ